MWVSRIGKAIRKRYTQWCQKPIEVFLFHAVSDEFDERRNKRIDWSQTEDFKNRIHLLKRKYRFISLDEAYGRLRKDRPRWRRYAVLTCDDGFASVLDVLPFLEQEQVPVTLFINPKYLDGVSRREGYAIDPQYLTRDQLWSLDSPLVTIGMHGYEHDDVTKKSVEEFEKSVEKCKEMLQSHPRYIPFFAYTWGKYSSHTQQLLKQKGIVPLLVNGRSNYHYQDSLGRRPIDSYFWEQTLERISPSRS